MLSLYRGRVAAFCAGLAGSGLAFGASVYETSFEEARVVYEEIFDQVVIERKICEEELARGVQQGAWTEAEQKEGVAWLQASFDAISNIQVTKLDAQSQVPLDPRWTYLKQRLDEHRGVTALNNAACVEFSKRVQSLDHARSAVAMRMCEAAVSLAEDVWLNAKTPGDLAPALRAIDYVRRGARIQWNAYASQQQFGGVYLPGSLPGAAGPGVSQDVVLTAMDFRSVIGIPKPLLLPDPDQNPAAFWVVSQDWNALRTMKHRFVLRPRIASRFAELDARYRSKMNGVRQRLEQMISTNAPAAEFENALRDFPEKPIPLQRPTSAFSSGQTPSGVPAYRDLIARRRPPTRAFTGAAYTAFANWLGFKLAEESGNEDELKIAARKLDKARSEFAPEVAKIVSERLSKVRPVERERTRNLYQLENSTGNPVNDLIATLAARENLETLAEAWRKVADEDATPLPESETLSPANWASIARAPENLGLINLRELAARQALASITQSPPSDKVTEPIATQLTEALEKAFASGSKAQARRLLRLDVANNILPHDEHMALRQVVELLPDPADPALEQDKAAIEKRLRALLSQATSPAAARFASEQFKKVRR